MTKSLEVPKLKTYKPRRVFHATSNITMTEDKDGNWVSRSDAEHLADMLLQANKRIAELEQSQPHHNGFMHLSQELAQARRRISELQEREVVIPSVWNHYSGSKVAFIYEQAMDEADIKWRSVDDKTTRSVDY